eukprot:8858694-Prorocentrum_lima.AAC.1
MTSSLVGSEMCIRDSPVCGHNTLLAFKAIKSMKSAARYHLCWLDGAGPVSYTHLTLPTICSV